MKISVIGVGYLGAVHAAGMAELGHDVIGLDVDAERVARLSRGDSPFHEPDFDSLLRRGLEAGRLQFTTAMEDLRDVEVHFLALGTPQGPNGGAADLSHLRSALADLVPVLATRTPAHAVVVGKSTVPVGTARELAEQLNDLPGVDLAWNPEFLREGAAVEDTLHPDRLVYGLPDPDGGGRAADVLDAAYAPILESGTPRLLFDYETAELVKVSANAMLATKLSFINAVAEVCEAAGGDVTQVAQALGLDDRIGPSYLRAGIGFGGGCLPKDIRSFASRAEELDVLGPRDLLREVDAINERTRERVIDRAAELLGGSVARRRVTVLGAAFKADSDDVRDSPALDVVRRLRAAGAIVTVTDPEALPSVQALHEGIRTVADRDSALRGAELVVLATDWHAYVELDPQATAERVDVPRMLDARNALDLGGWSRAGWVVAGMGRRRAQDAPTRHRILEEGPGASVLQAG